MCGQENKKMSVQDTVEELTQICIQIRRSLEDLTDQSAKEKLILKHIKEFADTGLRINDFQKGLEWFNVSEGLSLAKHLAGKIVILDFFTYCCINCMHILPDLHALEKKFSIEDGLVVVGVHSAKFANERDSTKILSAVQRYNIGHPVVNDAKLSMWRDIGIVCWPSLVMLGPTGQPLVVLVGEGHKEELFLYTKVALAYFKSQKEISASSLPLKPAQHLLPASRSTLLFPGKLQTYCTEQGEKLIVSDSGNNRILVMDINGKVEHVIGGYSPGFKDGNFEQARFNAPQGVCTLGNVIYVADNENHAIRKIDLIKKTVETVAGTGSQGHDYSGGKQGRDQTLSSPWDVAIYQHDSNGRSVPVLLIAIAGSHQIWALFLEDTIWWKKREYKAGTCAAIVGSGREENRNNSYPHAAGLAQPSGLAVAQELKAVFFADSESSTVRRVHLEDGKVSAVCGADKNPANLHCFGDVDGLQFAAKLQHPLGVTWHPTEKQIYIADTYNHKIKKVDSAGLCKTVFGAGKPSPEFSFDEPSGLAVSQNGNTLYVADTNNQAIKAIDLKNNTISPINVVLPEGKRGNNPPTHTFDIEISTKESELNILFEVKFENDLKLNSEAPQKWSVSFPTDAWAVKSAEGNLADSVSVQVPKGEGRKELRVTLDLVACKTTECIPKRLCLLFNVNQVPGAPSVVTEKKIINVK